VLVEAQGGRSDAASTRDLTDSQQIGTDHKFVVFGLDFKLSLTCIFTRSQCSQ
jgi:hypothetical protein